MLNTLYGIPVQVIPDRPRMQLSEDCPCTPEYRVELNAWMLAFFGTTNMIADGQVLHVTYPEERFVMNQRTFDWIRLAAAKSRMEVPY